MTELKTRLILATILLAMSPPASVAQTQPPTQPAKPAAPAPAAAAAPYPTVVIDAFISSCGRESGGRTEFCRCLVDGLQKKLSFNDFKRWETAGALGMQVAQSINEKVLDVAVQCRWPG
jgi:hypothetical protein